ALGIGANTAIFTLTDAILLRWLPVEDPQELVVLARNPSRPSYAFNYPDYRYVRDHNRSYSGVIAFSGGARPVSFSIPARHEGPQLVALAMVSGNYFEVLRVQPALGRVFNTVDNETEGAHPFVVLSHAFWKRAFGEDSGVVGRDVLLNGRRFQVIGVAREGFTGASVGVAPDLFAPIVMYRSFNPSASFWNTRMQWWLTVMARLKPGVTKAKAETELNVLWQQILQNDPRRRPVATWDKEYKINNTAVVQSGSTGQSYLRNQATKPLTVLMITVALVLVIACANVANLQLARGITRRREIAVRLAVGAGRGRLISQLLTESITLSILGGVAGLLFAWVGVRVLLGFLPRFGPFAMQLNLSPDLRLLGFAFGLAVLTGILSGLAPAFRATRPDVAPALKTDAATSSEGRAPLWDLRRTLVCFQVALSLLLLAGAGLFVRTLANLKNLDPGMTRENLLLVETNVGQLGYEPQRERGFHERLREEVQRLPGVRAAATAAITPLSGSRWNNNVQIEGYRWRPDEPPHVDMNAVTPRYFEAAGIPIVLGRDFRDGESLAVLPKRPDPPPDPRAEQPDIPGPPRVAIVNETFVRKFFGTESPIGRRLCMGEKWNPERTYEIVGVVRDARYFDLRKPVEPMIYQPMYREPRGGSGGALVVRTTGDADGLIAQIRRRVADVDGAVSITETRTMIDNLNRTLVQERFVATLGTFFGAVALLLAAIGLYGVMSQSVSRRTREIGIRMALGAEARRVLWLVLRDALLMVTVGAIVGAGTALVVTRYAESLLYGIKPQDPTTLAATAVLLLAVTMLAGFVPARRATRVQPMFALRHE
ncbi:MAG TPA: ABC transporter permease, partial [Bryobacteraceae bacterium]|nr:ABC transporter permease [Bryobacteraceae bacterium]